MYQFPYARKAAGGLGSSSAEGIDTTAALRATRASGGHHSGAGGDRGRGGLSSPAVVALVADGG